MRLPRLRLTRRRVITGAVVVVLVAGLLTWAAWPAPKNFTTEDRQLTVLSGPAGTEAVQLDTTLYLPRSASAGSPVPAVLLAHGFGGTKRSVRADAESFADNGYAVLTWTARGFGRSGGQIHLNSPDHEVRDAQRLIDWLAQRPEIATEAAGDPKVGVVGGSYGGALALVLAGYDSRVDAIVPMITWNDLARSFLPEARGEEPVEGVFKRQWAGIFFGSGSGLNDAVSDLAGAVTGGSDAEGGGGAEGGGAQGGAADPGGPPPGGFTPGAEQARPDPSCGRFAREICDAYLSIATTGRASAENVALLRRSSPASVVNRITAPTLLIQGQADSLFPLSEADANARGIAANGTPVHVDWFTGGHDGGSGPPSDVDRVKFLTVRWLNHYVKGEGEAPAAGFTYSRITGIDPNTRRLGTSAFTRDDYAGIAGTGTPATVTVDGRPQQIANPPNGTPAAITSLPGGGRLASFVNGVVLEVPGQHADFYSAPLTSTVDIVGSPTVQVRAASQTGSAVLFVKLYDVDENGRNSLPFGLSSPIRLSGLPADIDGAQPVTVTLPTIARRFEAGHRLRLTVSSADQAYATPVQPAIYTVGVPAGGAAVTLPTVPATPIASPELILRYVLVGLVAALALGLVVVLVIARVRRRRVDDRVVAQHVDTPLVVQELRKEYSDGFVAVSKVDFTVQRGQVVGLLGPNGAGKTTTLRVLMGLTHANKGDVYVFGHRLFPGAPVLTRLGALVEGPGFLPHLSGRANLRLYWRSTGRPAEDAHLDEALEIAGLGTAIDRRVRTYSHGMKQRLAIAQAMLGLPELLVLDEPTDGLDPPQIAEMRRVLHSYATDGRAVLVSSHLLAEVEQTCTHVVVMHRGEIVASGTVDEVVGDSPVVQLHVSDVDAASAVLGDLTGVRSVASDGNSGLIVDIDGAPRSDVVAALVHAGVGVDRVVPRRRLEDAFLALVGGDTKASGER